MTVFDGTLSENELRDEVEGVKKLIGESGELEKVDEWGRRQLGYPIKKRTSGYYVLFQYRAATSLPQRMTRTFKLNEKVLRHLTVVRDLRAEAKAAAAKAARDKAAEARQAAAEGAAETEKKEEKKEEK
jgi:small subunit ribosomal protein S6